MTAKVQYLGHDSFKIQSDYSSMVIDPFFTGNPYACMTVDDFIALDAMILTYGELDHIEDAVTIAKQAECTVVCTAEIAEYLKSQGISEDMLKVMAPGESDRSYIGNFTCVDADHPEGTHGKGCGFIVEVDGHKVYFAGATKKCDGMSKLHDMAIDIAILPIGGGQVMDVDEAGEAAEMINAREIIPMHYNTFPEIAANPMALSKKVPAGVAVTVLQSSEKETL